jgi:hypothetical protein
MNGKLLVVILSGSEDPYRVRWGLRLALNTHTHPYGDRLLDDVKVLLFAMGVSIVNPKMPFHEEFRDRLRVLMDAGVEVAACISIARNIGLEEEAENLGIKLVHASAYTAQHVVDGYTVMTF